MTSDDELRALLDTLVELRRDLHKHPELGFEEHRTQQVVMTWLERLGYAPRVCARTGVVADLRPDHGGRCVALRADLDCLPMEETLDIPHRSVHAGRAHKCGHDGHTATLLGVATVLARRRDTIPGNVRLIFQPAEEGVDGGGAAVMIEEGVLEGVDEIYAYHNWPGFPRGALRVAAGPAMASVHDVEIDLHGKGGHASQPQVTRDPVVGMAAMITALQTLVSRNLGALEPAVLSICRVRAGEANNVIPASAHLEGTLRTFDDAVATRAVARIREICEGVARAHDLTAEVRLHGLYPALHNHAQCADAVRDAASDIEGLDAISSEGLPLAAAEDFARFVQHVPGAYFFLGAGDGPDIPGCHHPDFDFDDRLILPAMRLFVRLVEQRLVCNG